MSIKQHVSAYSEAIARFTDVSYRRLLIMRGYNHTLLVAVMSIKQHVSAYSEAIFRFTNVSYRRLLIMRGYVVR